MQSPVVNPHNYFSEQSLFPLYDQAMMDQQMIVPKSTDNRRLNCKIKVNFHQDSQHTRMVRSLKKSVSKDKMNESLQEFSGTPDVQFDISFSQHTPQYQPLGSSRKLEHNNKQLQVLQQKNFKQFVIQG